MTDANLIRNVKVNESFQFSPGALPVRQKVVTFYVGTSGPFTLTYTLDQYSAERVRTDMLAEAATLRAIGALDGQ